MKNRSIIDDIKVLLSIHEKQHQTMPSELHLTPKDELRFFDVKDGEIAALLLQSIHTQSPRKAFENEPLFEMKVFFEKANWLCGTHKEGNKRG